MKLTKEELEVFDKMLVDKFNKQKAELDRLKEAYKVLQKKYDKATEEISILTEQVNLLKTDTKKTDPYKQLKQRNKELTLKIRDLHRLRDRLISKLAQYESQS